MGLLRFFLAFAVVNIHGKIFGFNIFPADAAVQCFYMISGFYMAMVLNEKYNQPGISNADFWKSRLFRIFPAYLLIASLTLLAVLVAWWGFSIRLEPFSEWSMFSEKFDALDIIILSLAQVSLFGLDFVHFFTIDMSGSVVFTPNFSQHALQLWRFLLVPQAWSLAVELYFYCLAPFIVRRSVKFMAILMVASLAIRLILALVFDFRFDPWSYRFFPSELMFFLSGALAWRLSKKEWEAPSWRKRAVLGLCCALIVAGGMLARVGLGGRVFFVSPIIMAALFLILPKIFLATKDNKIDRYIGELSYPLYVSHMLVIWISASLFVHGSPLQRMVVGVGSILFAILIYEVLDKRIDEFRHHFFARKRI